MKRHEFESCCHKSGKPTVNEFHLSAKYLSETKRLLASCFFGKLGIAIAEDIWGQPVDLLIPTSEDSILSYQENKRFLKRMLWIGIAILVTGIISTFWSDALGIVILAAGGILCLGSLVFALRPAAQLYRVVHCSGNYAWITGVHPDALKLYEPSKISV
ncbi:MAG: hypothetical protein AAGG48_28525 [Planctomycetota bacterium]